MGGEGRSLPFVQMYLGALFDADHHGVRPDQMLDASFFKPGVLHPANAVGPGVVETAVGLNPPVFAENLNHRKPAPAVTKLLTARARLHQ